MADSTVGTTTLLLAKTVSEEKETNGEKNIAKEWEAGREH